MTQINPEDVRVGDKIRRTRMAFGVHVVQELTVARVKTWGDNVTEIFAEEGGAISFYPSDTFTLELLSRPTEDAIYIDLGSGFTWRTSSNGKIIFSDMAQHIRPAFNDVRVLEEGAAEGRLAKVVLR